MSQESNETKKSKKKPKKGISPSEQIRNRGNRVTYRGFGVGDRGFYEGFINALKMLQIVKREHKPRFDTIYKRKLMCLWWLQGEEEEHGFCSPNGIRVYFGLNNNKWADSYFARLVREGWLIEVDKHLVKHTRGALSPMFYSLTKGITTTLRREFPDQAPPIEITTPQAQGLTPDRSTLDLIQDIPDLRDF